MRRPQTLDSPTLLIDEHRRVTPEHFANGCRQSLQLLGRFDIPRKEDYSPGLAFAQEHALRDRKYPSR